MGSLPRSAAYGGKPWWEYTDFFYLRAALILIAMGIYSPFSTRKPRQFEFKARYYDERKERLEALQEAARIESGEQTEATRRLAQARMQMAFDAARARRSATAQRKQGMRTLAIFVILVLVVLFYLHL